MPTTQAVLLNSISSLWCPADGAPAPYIVWKKNGIVVQNSTAVRFQLKVAGEKNSNYSCEVDRIGELLKKEIIPVAESKFKSNSCV